MIRRSLFAAAAAMLGSPAALAIEPSIAAAEVDPLLTKYLADYPAYKSSHEWNVRDERGFKEGFERVQPEGTHEFVQGIGWRPRKTWEKSPSLKFERVASA